MGRFGNRAGGSGGGRLRRGQVGSALMMVLTVVVVVGLVGVSVAAFARVNLRTTRSYDRLREDHYDADAAIKTAVNWVANNEDLGVDLNYNPNSATDCVYQVPAQDGATITVSCDAEAGSGSGVPPDQGINPPEGLLLLGDRHNEREPYSRTTCDSVLGAIWEWLSGGATPSPEYSFNAQKRDHTVWAGFLPCQDRNRGSDPIRVEGDVIAAGKIRATDGLKLMVEGGESGILQARYGCVLQGGAQIVQKGVGWGPGNKPVVDVGTGNAQYTQCQRDPETVRDANVDDPMPWDGSKIFTDPGRISSVDGGSVPDPIGDIQPEFLPVGFNADGTVDSAHGYTLPERTSAYIYNPTAYAALSPKPANVPENLVPLNSPVDGDNACIISNESPVIFLWGWYRSSEVLNRYTSEDSCRDRTFWFAPNPGADNVMLTSDDFTAAFYMDFNKSDSGVLNASKCGGVSDTHYARWCLGGYNNEYSSTPRVVVGWPNEWAALPIGDGGGSGSTPQGYGNSVPIEISDAEAIEGNFLSYWKNTGNAKSVDAQFATYEPCKINFLWWIIPCPSLDDRSLRMADFSPEVTSGPIGEAPPGNAAGKLYVDLHLAMANATGMVPKVVVSRLDDNGDPIDCGEYTLDLTNVNAGYDGSSPWPSSSIATISEADAKNLANACGAVAQINNLRVTFKVSGNWLNNGSNPPPTFYLDGARIHYDSYQGASFPLPEDATASDPGTVGDNGIPADPAKSDCDPEKPGGQLIFGAESHVLIPDGSLEVCGGPNPEDPKGSMVIGVYGVPSISPLRPSSVAWAGGDGLDTGRSLEGAKRIGDPEMGAGNSQPNPIPSRETTIHYGDGCSPSIGCESIEEGRIDLTYPGFAAPAGYQVTSIQALASYNPKNAGACALNEFYGDTVLTDINNFFFGCTAPQLRQGGASTNYLTNDDDIYVNDVLKAGNGAIRQLTSLYPDQDPGSNAVVTPGELSSGVVLQWAARGKVVCGLWICPPAFDDEFDGVEMVVETQPTTYVDADPNNDQPMLRPQSGCITSRPGYDRGVGKPDCALMRSESYSSSDSGDAICIFNCPESQRRTTWFGRFSVRGTIYAPSSAVEVDVNDLGYPLASRGAILRHLWISGAKERENYVEPAIGGDIDRTPRDRRTILTACLQEGGSPSTTRPCDADQGDRILARSGVTFTTDPNVSEPVTTPVALVDWYTDEVQS